MSNEIKRAAFAGFVAGLFTAILAVVIWNVA